MIRGKLGRALALRERARAPAGDQVRVCGALGRI